MRNAKAAALVCAAVMCGGFARADVAQDALAGVTRAYPGVQVLDAGGSRMFHGRTLNDGATPVQAANDFVNAHRDAFGVAGVTLGLREHAEGNFGSLHNFVYGQTMDGLPVEHAFVSVVVRSLAAAPGLENPLVHAVVLAQGLVAPAPAGGFAPDMLDAAQAEALVKSTPGYDTLTKWHGDAHMVVYPGFAGEQPAVRAWKFSASDINAERPRAFTFFVDAATGTLVHVRNDIHHADITGNVVGLVTPPNRPDVPTNLPVQQAIGEVKVEVQGTSPLVFAFTQRDGTFTIPWADTDPVTLRVATAGGHWSNVTNSGAGGALSVTQAATPGTPVTIDLLSAPTAATQAQVNGLFYTSQTHNFIRDRASIPTLDVALPTFVNEASTCNAFFLEPDSIHFFSAGGGCVNTAYASVVNHEYGHFIVNERGLAQGAFGEGYADTMSILINDDPIIGREFGLPPNGWVRNLETTTRMYPCTGAVHDCGEVLGRVVWNLRNNLTARYGAPLGLTTAQDMIGDWSVIMTGGEDTATGNNSAHPGTAAQWLTVDDNDGNTSNGTPNYPQIRASFLERNIPVPCVDARVLIQPLGIVPAVITTGSQPLTVPVSITAGTAQVITGSPAVKWRNAGSSDPYQSIPMTQSGPPGSYTANFPTLTCGQAIQYYYSVDTSETYNGTTTELTFPSHTCGDPSGAFATQATDASTSFTDNFEVADPQWTRTIAGQGSWIRSDFTSGSTATGSNPTSDTTPPPGINAWITGKDFQTNPNAGDLFGTSILTSPTYNLAGAAGAIVSYQRWFSLTDPQGAQFRTEVSVDNGATWVAGETLTATEGNQWRAGGFSLGALGLTPSATTRVRFVGFAPAGSTIFEAGVDDFTIATLTCNTTPSCDPIDFNGDTLFPDTSDIADFLTVFGGGTCPTGTCGDIDFNNDGLFPDTEDITTLLRVFGGGNC